MGDTTKDELDLLEAKVSALEMKVFGDSESVMVGPPIIDVLLKSESMINTAISSYEKIGKMAKRVEELDATMDPSLESTVLQDTTKVEMLCLMYNEINDILDQVKRLQESSEVLNSDQIRSIPKVEFRLTALARLMQENKEVIEKASGRVQNVLVDYTKLINAFTRTFVELDEIVTELEVVSVVKKDVD